MITANRCRVNLTHLVEEAIDGCWIGHRARTDLQDSGIGSVYSPPGDGFKLKSNSPTSKKRVESVIDIGYRESVRLPCFLSSMLSLITSLQGWEFKCEKGGIRRVLMNLYGNSLKFTAVRAFTRYALDTQ